MQRNDCAPVRLGQEPGRATLGGLQRTVAVRAKAETQCGNAWIVVARLQAPRGALRQAERQIAERDRRRVVAEAQYRTDHTIVAGQEQQFLCRRAEIELTEIAPLRLGQTIQKAGKSGWTHGMQRTRRLRLIHQTIESLFQHRVPTSSCRAAGATCRATIQAGT